MSQPEGEAIWGNTPQHTRSSEHAGKENVLEAGAEHTADEDEGTDTTPAQSTFAELEGAGASAGREHLANADADDQPSEVAALREELAADAAKSSALAALINKV